MSWKHPINNDPYMPVLTGEYGETECVASETVVQMAPPTSQAVTVLGGGASLYIYT